MRISLFWKDCETRARERLAIFSITIVNIMKVILMRNIATLWSHSCTSFFDLEKVKMFNRSISHSYMFSHFAFLLCCIFLPWWYSYRLNECKYMREFQIRVLMWITLASKIEFHIFMMWLGKEFVVYQKKRWVQLR